MSTITAAHRSWRSRIFILTWLGYAGFYLCRKNYSFAMVPLRENLGYSNTALGWIVTANLLMYALFQFVHGFLGDVRGPRFTMGIGLLVVVAVNVIAGLTAGLFTLAVLMAINGAAQASGWPNCVKCMGNWFVIRERGRVMGWWCTCYAVGGVIGTWYATKLYDLYHKRLTVSLGEQTANQEAWRIVFIGPALTLLVIAVLFILFARNRPRDAGLAELDEFDGIGERTGSPEIVPLSKNEERTEFYTALREVLTNRTVWTFCAVYFCLKFIRYGMLTWLPTYARQELGYDIMKSGYTSVGFELVAPIGVLACGYISDMLFQSRRGPICAISLGLLTAICLLQTKMTYWGPWPYFIGLCLIGFFVFGPDALLSGPAAQDFGSQRAAGICAGLLNGMGSFGSVLQGPLIGWATDNYEGAWSWLFYVFAGMALIAALLCLTTWNDLPKAHTDRRNGKTA